MFGLITHTVIRKAALLVIVALQVEWCSDTVFAETWVCSRPGQSDLYTDHGSAGCSKLSEVKGYSTLQIAPKLVGSPLPGAGPPSAAPIASVSTPATEPRNTITFF